MTPSIALVLRLPLPDTPAQCMHLAIVGFLLQSMYFGVCYLSFAAGLSVGTLALILAMQPIVVGLIAPRWNGEGVSWQLLVSLAYLVIASSLIAVGLLLAMIRAGEVSRVSALFFLVPPLAAALAWAVLGEAMPPLAWLGMAIAGLGVLMATKSSRSPHRRRPQSRPTATPLPAQMPESRDVPP